MDWREKARANAKYIRSKGLKYLAAGKSRPHLLMVELRTMEDRLVYKGDINKVVEKMVSLKGVLGVTHYIVLHELSGLAGCQVVNP
jgi:hypothetical protein